MGNETADTAQTQQAQPCACSELAQHLVSLFGVPSEDARNHLRNARIEVLKAVRTMIDERIDRLSRTRTKGTNVPVE